MMPLHSSLVVGNMQKDKIMKSLSVVLLLALSSACGSIPQVATEKGAAGTPAIASNCAATSVGFTPLTEPGTSPYPDVSLGLYPGGTNQIPAAHLAAGVALAGGITPRRPNGNPHPNGKIGLISVGISNASHEFEAFIALQPSPNPKVKIVDGAQFGQTAKNWSDPLCECWLVLDARIQSAGLTNAQVQVAWVKLANSRLTGGWPEEKDVLQAGIEATVRLLATRFLNMRVAYLSSRVYGGYATTITSPEPYAYQGGFAVQGVIATQLNGALPYMDPGRVAPWLAWGPYLWADGLTPRADGLTWACSDFESDGTHPSEAGKAKVAGLLTTFFTTHATTAPWFGGGQ